MNRVAEPPPIEPREHQAELRGSPSHVLRLLERSAEEWGGAWQAGDENNDDPRSVNGRVGRLGLPVAAGLRRGWLAGPVVLERLDGDRTRLRFRVESGEYFVDRGAVAILVVAGAGAVSTVLAPLIPRLWPFVPIGMVLGIAAWLMVIARLRNSGPEEFLLDLSRQDGDAEDPPRGR
jgi:hypothetical protein